MCREIERNKKKKRKREGLIDKHNCCFYRIHRSLSKYKGYAQSYFILVFKRHIEDLLLLLLVVVLLLLLLFIHSFINSFIHSFSRNYISTEIAII